MSPHFDILVLTPDDIDLGRSPIAGHLDAETYVLGAFNPGLTRLENGNLLMMVRVAEALREPIVDGNVRHYVANAPRRPWRSSGVRGYFSGWPNRTS